MSWSPNIRWQSGPPQGALSLWEAGPIVPSPGRREVPAQDHPALAQSLARPGMPGSEAVSVTPNCPVCVLPSALGRGSTEGAMLWAVLLELSFLPSYAQEMQKAAEYHWPSEMVSLWTWSPKEWGAGESGLEISPPQWDPPPPAQLPPLSAPPPHKSFNSLPFQQQR